MTESFEVSVDRPEGFVDSEGAVEVSFHSGAIEVAICGGEVVVDNFSGAPVFLNEFEFAELVNIWHSRRPEDRPLSALYNVEWKQSAKPEYGGGVIQDWILWEDDDGGHRVSYEDAWALVKFLKEEDRTYLQAADVEYRVMPTV